MSLDTTQEKTSKFATFKNRWIALVGIALGLAIVIVDATILNVSIPYMLRDLNTSFSSIQWAISGYALAIATVLITIGRIGDLWGRKKLFVAGMAVFAVGSLVASESQGAALLIFGRACIQAIGAAMVLTSALALLAATFHGKERAIAFGVWGAVAGASASLGPLLGGYLTTYYSWRWSLRINVVVAIIAFIFSIFIMESRGEKARKFDWWGMIFSGLGIFSLVFGFIEGRTYGWWNPREQFSFLGWQWPFEHFSVIPIFFALSVIFITLFIWKELSLERKGMSPLLRLDIFKKRGFTVGSALLVLLSLGQFGTFLILPIYFENVLGYDALQTGVAFLLASISIFVFGIISGYLASKINIKWIIIAGTIILVVSIFVLIPEITSTATQISLAPGLILFGIGLGLSASQLNNVIISSAPAEIASEASGASVMMRQIGSSIGVAIIGAFFATSIVQGVQTNIQSDPLLPEQAKVAIVSQLGSADFEAGQSPAPSGSLPPAFAESVKKDINESVVSASQDTMNVGWYFLIAAALASCFLPKFHARDQKAPSQQTPE